MQLVHCTVRHAGDPRHTVRKSNVSIPEVILLRHIHGGEKDNADAVPNEEISYAGERDLPASEEIDHLRKHYGQKQENLDLIDKLFGGFNPNLPASLSDLGLADVTDAVRNAAYKRDREAADADRVRMEKAAKADGRQVVGAPEDDVIPPPPAPRRTTLTPKTPAGVAAALG